MSSEDFKRLAIMSNLSERIKLRSDSSCAENEKKLRVEGPDFVCVVRDFHLNNKKYTPNESLDRFLQMEKEAEQNEKTKNDAAVIRNQIRKNMINSFKSFQCFRLPIPVSDDTVKNKQMEKALQILDSIAFNQLRTNFRNEFR